MSSATPTSVIRWPVFVLLATPAVGAALAITFAADHSVHFGLVVLGAFGLGTALVSALAALVLPASGPRVPVIIRAVLAAAAGALSLSALGWAVAPGADPAAAAAVLSWLVAATLLPLAAADLAAWLRLRGKDRVARDWLVSAIIQVVGGIAPLVVPADFVLPYVVRDGDHAIPLELTAPIVMVGLTGAVLAILGVYLVIAGLSLLPPRRPAVDAAHDAAVRA